MRSPIAEETAATSVELPFQNTKSEAAAEVLPSCMVVPFQADFTAIYCITASLRKVQKEVPKKSKKSSSSSSSTSSDKKRKKTPLAVFFVCFSVVLRT